MIKLSDSIPLLSIQGKKHIMVAANRTVCFRGGIGDSKEFCPTRRGDGIESLAGFHVPWRVRLDLLRFKEGWDWCHRAYQKRRWGQALPSFRSCPFAHHPLCRLKLTARLFVVLYLSGALNEWMVSIKNIPISFRLPFIQSAIRRSFNGSVRSDSGRSYISRDFPEPMDDQMEYKKGNSSLLVFLRYTVRPK